VVGDELMTMTCTIQEATMWRLTAARGPGAFRSGTSAPDGADLFEAGALPPHPRPQP